MSLLACWLFAVYLYFYRAMHFSAKRGIAIACRLSVCLSVRPSVTLVDQDHIGWKSWKLISRTISPTPVGEILPSAFGNGHYFTNFGETISNSD